MAKLLAFWRINAIETNALTVNFDCVTVDDGSTTNKGLCREGWGGDCERCECDCGSQSPTAQQCTTEAAEIEVFMPILPNLGNEKFAQALVKGKPRQPIEDSMIKIGTRVSYDGGKGIVDRTSTRTDVKLYRVNDRWLPADALQAAG